MVNLDKLQKLRNLLNKLSVKGIVAGDLLVQLLNSVATGINPFSFKYIALPFLSYSFKQVQFASEEVAVSLGPYGRDGYYDLLKYVTASSKIHFNFDKIKIVPSFSFTNMLAGFSLFRALKKELSFKDCCYLAFSYVFYLNSLKVLEKSVVGRPKMFLSLNANQPGEALLTLFFKNKGVKTVTLQHALYRFPKAQENSVDVIFFSHLNADECWCWSAYSVDQFIKYCINVTDSKHFVLGGYPFDMTLKPLNAPKVTQQKFKVAVLLGWSCYEMDNKRLLQEICQFTQVNKNWEFIIKLHPELEVRTYQHLMDGEQLHIFEGDMSELMNCGLDAALTVSTTAYYDMLMSGVIAFRYSQEGHFDEAFILPTDIQHLARFKELLFKISNDLDLQNKIKSRLKYVIGIGVNNYSELVKH